MDKLTPERRSWNMSRIRSGDTRPERVVRSLLHRMGYRFSLRRKDLPGKPDIVLPKYKTVVFVHGCFWHRHPGCIKASIPKTHSVFWRNKLITNVKRDICVVAQLKKLGWQVIVVWQCELSKNISKVIKRMDRAIVNRGKLK